jgi:hypothetical protein
MKHLIASTIYIALDGTAFALSSGGLMIAAGMTATTLLVQNPSRFSRTVARHAALVVAGRITYSLLRLCRSRVRRLNKNDRGIPGKPNSPGSQGTGDNHQGDAGDKDEGNRLTSIWDWQPPDSDTANMWFVLKELVQTFNTISTNYPEIQSLLDSTSDLPQRLWYYLDTNVDDMRATWQDEDKPLSEDDERGLALLKRYREFCIYSYDCTSDRLLEERLSSRGFKLIGAKYVSDERSPAFYLASNAARETILCIRGTFSGNDVITDLVAAGAPWEGGYAHAGMARAAAYLIERFGDFLLSAAEQDHGVVTVCGHSLGAGVAALVTHSLSSTSSLSSRQAEDGAWGAGKKGRIRCLCYEPPACMSAPLAASITDSTYSTVNRDDLVPRLGPTPIVNLLHNLQDFDWRQAAEKDEDPFIRRITLLLAGNDGERSGEARKRCQLEPNEDWHYDPVVPGKVFFITPGSAPVRIDAFSEVLRSLRLTRTSVQDHFVDTEEFMTSLGVAQWEIS